MLVHDLLDALAEADENATVVVDAEALKGSTMTVSWVTRVVVDEVADQVVIYLANPLAG